MIDGIRFQNFRGVLAGKLAELKPLFRGLLQFVLVYYLDPAADGQPHPRLAGDAALGGADGGCAVDGERGAARAVRLAPAGAAWPGAVESAELCGRRAGVPGLAGDGRGRAGLLLALGYTRSVLFL